MGAIDGEEGVGGEEGDSAGAAGGVEGVVARAGVEKEGESAGGVGEVEVASAEGSRGLEGDGAAALVFGTSPLYTCRLSKIYSPFEGDNLGWKPDLGSKKHHFLR